MNIIALSGGFYTGSSAVHQLISGCNDFFCLPCQYDEFDLVREPKRGLAAFVRCPTENVDGFVKYLSTDCMSSYKMIRNLVHFSDSNKIIVAKLKYWRCIIRFFRRILTHESFFYFVSKLLGISAKCKYKLKKEFNQQDTIAGNNLLLNEAKSFFDDILSTLTSKDSAMLSCLVLYEWLQGRFVIDYEYANKFLEGFLIKKFIFVTRDPRDSYCSYIARAIDYINSGGKMNDCYAYSDSDAYKYIMYIDRYMILLVFMMGSC